MNFFAHYWNWFIQSFGLYEHDVPWLRAQEEAKECVKEPERCFTNENQTYFMANEARVPEFIAHHSEDYGTSALMFRWHMLNEEYNGFASYGFGLTKNMERYGQALSPQYNMETMKIPTSMMVGSNDTFTNDNPFLWYYAYPGYKANNLTALFAYKQFDCYDHETFLIGRDTSEWI